MRARARGQASEQAHNPSAAAPHPALWPPPTAPVQVDTAADEALQQLSSGLGVKALPAFRFFKAGKEVGEPVRAVHAAHGA
jgi:hypothetical protein